MEILHIEDLTFRYPDAPRPALQNVSLSVSDGEFAVIWMREIHAASPDKA